MMLVMGTFYFEKKVIKVYLSGVSAQIHIFVFSINITAITASIITSYFV